MDPKRASAKAQAVIEGYKDIFGEDISRGELLYLLCVGEHETHCGDDWKDGHGNPTHNWGAVQWRSPNKDEMLRIQNGDLKVGDTIPGGILQQDSSPGKGKYYVWFRTFPSDRNGAAFLAGVLYKHNPEARKAAQADGNATDFATAMYQRGYYEGVHTGARGVYGAKGEVLRSPPFNAGEMQNIDDYASSIDKLYPQWEAALSSLPLVGPAKAIETVDQTQASA